MMHNTRLSRLSVSLWAASILLVSGQVCSQTSRIEALRTLEGIAAVVNAEVITRQELARQIEQVRRQLASRNIELPPADVLSSQVLDRMITDRAQVQMAREMGIRIDEVQLERALGSIAAERGLTMTQLRARADSEGAGFERLREDVRIELMQARLREREVDARVQISEADIDAFIAERERSAAEQLEFELAQILVRVAEGASADEIQRRRARAEEVLAAASRSGTDFATLAASFSDAGDAMSGGSLGWRAAERLPQIFVDAARKLKPGGVTLVRSPNGFHVLKLVNQRSAASDTGLSAPVTQTRARHLLLRVGDGQAEAQALRRISDIRARIANGSAEFAEMARQNSADGTAGRGGELGWILPGDTVPEFERAMNALKPGELSEPVRSPFGFHLIEVLERRVEAAAPDRVRSAAKQALREQRSEEVWQDWLRQLRDSTYVELRIDES